MNITVEKIKRTLEKDYGWSNLMQKDNEWFLNEIIKDTLDIINNELIRHKGISIKNTKPKQTK